MFQIFASISYYALSAALAVVIVVNAGAASEDYGALYEHFSPSSKADSKLKSVLEALSLGFYKGGTEKNKEIEQIVGSAASHERYADIGSWILLAMSSLFLVLKSLTLERGPTIITRGLTAHVLGISFVFLVVGLIAPILSLVAYTDVAVLGKVVFRYESKGILTTVLELVGSGNVFVAAVLFTFSVITPIVKLILTFLAIKSPHDALRKRYVRLLSAIGKWSMADVLVVAILLSFFVSGSDEFSDSWLGPGLYFFTGYCLLSLMAVQFIAYFGDEAAVEP